MDITRLVDTIYLGDRSCKSLNIDIWNEIIKLQIDIISRISPNSDDWNYYTDEDIEDGFIVFEGVISFKYDSSESLPNGYINMFDVKKIEDEKYLFNISLGSYSKIIGYKEVNIKIIARNMYLEDTKMNTKITS